MRAIIKKLIGPIVKKVHATWLKKPRRYSYKNISVWVAPGVFPPFVTFSTRLLLEFAESLQLEGKSFLELGCGCGIVSILAAKNGAHVTATDINEVALKTMAKNAAENDATVEIVHSDLFGNLKNRTFDFIIINPPYYAKAPKSIEEQAWFCGENFEYFGRLFKQLRNFSGRNEVYMILSEDCEIEKINAIAFDNAINMDIIRRQSVVAERNFIFSLTSL